MLISPLLDHPLFPLSLPFGYCSSRVGKQKKTQKYRNQQAGKYLFSSSMAV